ncbi:hypothetical protein P4S64_14630 [Vibrio sp. M60_M31a]
MPVITLLFGISDDSAFLTAEQEFDVLLRVVAVLVLSLRLYG